MNLEEVKKVMINEEELTTVEVGDLVDVDMEFDGQYTVRVLQVLDDVSKHCSLDPEPGIFGRIVSADNDPPMDGVTLVFGQSQILPWSKLRYYW